jgi:hypothetical protein
MVSWQGDWPGSSYRAISPREASTVHGDLGEKMLSTPTITWLSGNPSEPMSSIRAPSVSTLPLRREPSWGGVQKPHPWEPG